MTDRRTFLASLATGVVGVASTMIGFGAASPSKPKYHRLPCQQTGWSLLYESMQKDPDYAWSWHCNVAVASMDEGMPYRAANRAAARFMMAAFGVDTTRDRRYAGTEVA